MSESDSNSGDSAYRKFGNYFNAERIGSPRTTRVRENVGFVDEEGNTASEGTPSSRRTSGANIGTRAYIDGSDYLANQYKQVISFFHIPSQLAVYFKAFLTAYNETYSPEWTEESVYGRADPIYMFKQTTRNITVGIKIPAATTGEAAENLERLQRLIQFLYPAYKDVASGTTISQSPLIRLKFQNMISKYTTSDAGTATEFGIPTNTNQAVDGLLGVVKNLTVNYNMEGDVGVFQMNGTILPKLIELNFDFSVVHEHSIGWQKNGDNMKFAAPKFPYGMNTSITTETTREAMQSTNTAPTTVTREQLRADRERQSGLDASEAAEANQAGRNMGMFGALRNPDSMARRGISATGKGVVATGRAIGQGGEWVWDNAIVPGSQYVAQGAVNAWEAGGDAFETAGLYAEYAHMFMDYYVYSPTGEYLSGLPEAFDNADISDVPDDIDF